MPETEIISVRDAAAIAGVHSVVIYRVAAKGYIKARRVGRRIFISRASFESWRKRLETRRALRIEECSVRERREV